MADEVLWCPCPCHGRPVDCTDPIEAVTACAHCVNAHFPALKDYLYDPPPAPRQKEPWVDPPAQNDQADGETGG